MCQQLHHPQWERHRLEDHVERDMHGSRKFCQRGSTSENCFSWRGERESKYHYKWTIIGPPAKDHLNGVPLACRWRPYIESSLVALWLFKESGPVLLIETLYFCDFFRGWGESGSPVPPLDPRIKESGPVLLVETLYFCDFFRGWGGVWIPCPSSGSAHKEHNFSKQLGKSDLFPDIGVPKWDKDGVCMHTIINVSFTTQKVNEYDQEIPQSHTTDQPTAPWRRGTEL